MRSTALTAVNQLVGLGGTPRCERQSSSPRNQVKYWSISTLFLPRSAGRDSTLVGEHPVVLSWMLPFTIESLPDATDLRLVGDDSGCFTEWLSFGGEVDGEHLDRALPSVHAPILHQIARFSNCAN